jgi:hypothetical protein
MDPFPEEITVHGATRRLDHGWQRHLPLCFAPRSYAPVFWSGVAAKSELNGVRGTASRLRISGASGTGSTHTWLTSSPEVATKGAFSSTKRPVSENVHTGPAIDRPELIALGASTRKHFHWFSQLVRARPRV